VVGRNPTVNAAIQTLVDHIETVARLCVASIITHAFAGANNLYRANVANSGAKFILTRNPIIHRSRERRICNCISIADTRSWIVLDPVLPYTLATIVTIKFALAREGTISASTLVAHTAFEGCARSFARAYTSESIVSRGDRIVHSTILAHIGFTISSNEAAVASAKAALPDSPTRAVNQKITVVAIEILIADTCSILRARTMARASNVRLLHRSRCWAKLHRAISPCP